MFERGEIKDVDISISGLLELGFLAIVQQLKDDYGVVTLDSNSVQEGKGHPRLRSRMLNTARLPKGELRYSLPKVKWARKELRKDWLISTRTAILRSFIPILKLLIYVLISIFEVMVADFLTSNVATSDWNFRPK